MMPWFFYVSRPPTHSRNRNESQTISLSARNPLPSCLRPVPSRCVDISARRLKSIPQWTVEEEGGEWKKGNHNDREVMSSRRAKPTKPPVVSELYKHAGGDEKKRERIAS